jgi:BirA family biotin operon repressor/biotin-[acetyl-CoA-carboxylase] ligase
MDQLSVDSMLADLHLPAIRFFFSIDSTNDEAWRWVRNGAPHAALVVADEQTAGRGRSHHHWVTVVGSGLAFSLILCSPPLDPQAISRLTGLGALATCQALARQYSLHPQVKWANDILLGQHKVGGVLAEARWNGNALEAVVVGIGINIAPQSLDPRNLPAQGLRMPATCVESVLGKPVDRLILLHAILEKFLGWLPHLASPEFLHAWEESLAYREQWVELKAETEFIRNPPAAGSSQSIVGKVIGLNSDGALRLLTVSGEMIAVQAGEIHLRPIAAPPD